MSEKKRVNYDVPPQVVKKDGMEKGEEKGYTSPSLPIKKPKKNEK